MKSESQFQRGLLQELNNIGWFYKASDRYRAGIPDVIGTVEGRFVALELKVDKRKVTDLQWFELQRIVKNGGYAQIVVYNNQTKTINMGTQTFTNKKDLVQWILKQSRLNTNGNCCEPLVKDPTTPYSSNQD